MDRIHKIPKENNYVGIILRGDDSLVMRSQDTESFPLQDGESLLGIIDTKLHIIYPEFFNHYSKGFTDGIDRATKELQALIDNYGLK